MSVDPNVYGKIRPHIEEICTRVRDAVNEEISVYLDSAEMSEVIDTDEDLYEVFDWIFRQVKKNL